MLRVRRALGFRQPSLDDPRRDLCPRGKAQLPRNIAHMPFGGSFAEHQERRFTIEAEASQ